MNGNDCTILIDWRIEHGCDYSGGDPSLYDDYYTSLKVFVEQSLDVHKVRSGQREDGSM